MTSFDVTFIYGFLFQVKHWLEGVAIPGFTKKIVLEQLTKLLQQSTETRYLVLGYLCTYANHTLDAVLLDILTLLDFELTYPINVWLCKEFLLNSYSGEESHKAAIKALGKWDTVETRQILYTYLKEYAYDYLAVMAKKALKGELVEN